MARFEHAVSARGLRDRLAVEHHDEPCRRRLEPRRPRVVPRRLLVGTGRLGLGSCREHRRRSYGEGRRRTPDDSTPATPPLRLPPIRFEVVLASIPSPDSGNLGPFHMYGVLLAIGVLVAVWIAERRWRRRGYGSPGISDVAFWVVVWGVVGARLYHVITDYQRFDDDPLRAFQIWKGGLSIWGAVIGGAIAVIVTTHRRHMPTLVVMDCMAPGILAAQAIGRWGNWFNQELFGKPTTLPWGLEISLAHRPLGLPAVRDVPPDVPLRVALLRGTRRCSLARREASCPSNRGKRSRST